MNYLLPRRRKFLFLYFTSSTPSETFIFQRYLFICSHRDVQCKNILLNKFVHDPFKSASTSPIPDSIILPLLTVTKSTIILQKKSVFRSSSIPTKRQLQSSLVKNIAVASLLLHSLSVIVDDWMEMLSQCYDMVSWNNSQLVPGSGHHSPMYVSIT